MISGAHFLLYSTEADADRAFLRDVLQFHSVDLGHGWLIFRLPPSEIAVHPGSGEFTQTHADSSLTGAVLYLMCDDLDSTMRFLAEKRVECGPVSEAEWGRSTSFSLPSGGKLGLYQPRHQTAIE